MTPATDLPEVPPTLPRPSELVEPADARDPDRAPDWRWQRVVWLNRLRRGKSMSQDEDKLTRLGFQFYRAMKKARTPAQRRAVRTSYPQLYAAWRLHDLLQDDDGATPKPRRAPKTLVWSLEAYLCANASKTDIAYSLGMHPACVGFYSKFFFDLEGRRDQIGWMANVACGFNGNERMELPTQWKTLGLLCGPEFLNWLFLQGSRQPFGDPGRQADALTAEGCCINALLVARGHEQNAQERKLALQVWTRLRATDNSGSQDSSDGIDAENLKVLLSFFKFVVRPVGSAKDLPAMEPRAEVLLPGAPKPEPWPEGCPTTFPEPGEAR
jgi:hypothetical protein